MACDSTHFQELSFCGSHENPHGVRGFSKHYHLRLAPTLGHGKFSIRRIPCVGISCKHMLDKPRVIGSNPTRQPHYQPVEDCIHWPLLGSFNSCNRIKFTNKITTNKDFDAMHKVLLIVISEKVYELIHNGKYGAIYNADPTTMGYYVVKFLSEPYTLQEK